MLIESTGTTRSKDTKPESTKPTTTEGQPLTIRQSDWWWIGGAVALWALRRGRGKRRR